MKCISEIFGKVSTKNKGVLPAPPVMNRINHSTILTAPITKYTLIEEIN